MNEVWKPITGYEGKYEISNYGNVKSLNFRNKGEECLLRLHNTHRYYQAALTKDGITKYHLVHRLVAEAFIPNPHNYPLINHKDECGFNNHVDNLEWCTHKENINYGSCIDRRAKNCRKPVISKCGDIIEFYDSVTSAAKAINRNKSSVCAALKSGKILCGRKWEYAKECVQNG